MNLCHVVPSLEDRHGGPSRSVRALCAAIARAGHTVDLLTTAEDAPPEGNTTTLADRFQVRTFQRVWPARICRSPGLSRALQASDADVIHHHSLWLRTLHYAAAAATRRQAPLVLSPRGMMSDWAWNHRRIRKRVAQTFIHPRAFHRAAGWHATSEDEAGEIRDRGIEQPVCVAPNGVEVPTSAERAAAAEFWLALCPEIASRRTALFYSRFHEKKRVVELIDVWLEHAAPDWTLLLVGIPEEYTPEDLENYATRMSGTGRVRAYTGANRPPPYAAASLFLLPSHSENFGLVIAEAMASEIPPLVTDTTPWRQLDSRGAGWCVPWREYGAAVAAATRMAPDALQQRGQRARQWVEREFSWDRVAQPLLAFYDQLRTTKRQPA